MKMAAAVVSITLYFAVGLGLWLDVESRYYRQCGFDSDGVYFLTVPFWPVDATLRGLRWAFDLQPMPHGCRFGKPRVAKYEIAPGVVVMEAAAETR